MPAGRTPPRPTGSSRSCRRYGCGSIVLTSNRGFGDWGQVFADQVVAGEILDEKGATTFPAGYTTSFRIGWALD
jgi:hypothetical protein